MHAVMLSAEAALRRELAATSSADVAERVGAGDVGSGARVVRGAVGLDLIDVLAQRSGRDPEVSGDVRVRPTQRG
jgi:hypothetical protein